MGLAPTLSNVHSLSKSRYLRGLQCHKSLYLNQFHRDLQDPPDPSKEAIFSTGHKVGELARELFPGGVLAVDGHPSRVKQSLERTQRLIADGEDVLYEPAVQHNGVLAYVDILVREGELWHAYEVKSSSKVKDVNYHDAAIQYYILNGDGVELSDISIVHLNTSYVRQGVLDLEQLFNIVSVLPKVQELQPEVPGHLNDMRDVLAGDQAPEIDIGPHCSDPYDCSFMGHCWAHVPELSVFNVAWLKQEKKFDLYGSGILRIEEIPDDYELTARSNFHVESHKNGREVIDRQAIRKFIEGLRYPLYFLDFETYNPAIPPFDGTKPYGKNPFQYSLHRKKSPDAVPTHSGFLADAGSDSRGPLVRKLLKEVGDAGDIVVYNQSFEITVIKQLAQQLAREASELEALLPRIRDLMAPFQKRHYYHPNMNGKYSIKNVLPALAPDLSYGGLAIPNGELAMQAFAELQAEDDPARVKAIRSDLWEYCKLDTLAMVRILEQLDGKCEIEPPRRDGENGGPE
jgi:hypothetical protein